MALQTLSLATFTDPSDGSQCEFQIDWDDAASVVSVFRCINNTGSAGSGALVRGSDGLIYSQIFPSHQTTFINIPTSSQAQRLAVQWLNGVVGNHLVSIRTVFDWPA